MSTDHLLEILEVDSLSWTTSRLDPSLDCLAYDLNEKKLYSVSCQDQLPMVCIRPELKKTYAIGNVNLQQNTLNTQNEFEMLIDAKGYNLLVGVVQITRTSKNYANLSDAIKKLTAKPSHPISGVDTQLSCYVGNDYVYRKYVEIDKTELEFSILRKNYSNSLPEWMGPQVKCETWDVSSYELLHASRTLPGGYSNALASFIVRYRVRNVKYDSSVHDPTFTLRNPLHKSTANLLRMTFHEEFGKHIFLEPSTDPLIYYRDIENSTHPSIISSYRLVLSLENQTEDQAFTRLQTFVTTEFKQSTDKRKLQIEVLDVRSTEFCPTQVTNNRGEVINGTQNIRIVNRLPTVLVWPKTRAGSLATPQYPCIDENGNLIERRCLGDRITGLFWEPLQDKVTNRT